MTRIFEVTWIERVDMGWGDVMNMERTYRIEWEGDVDFIAIAREIERRVDTYRTDFRFVASITENGVEVWDNWDN